MITLLYGTDSEAVRKELNRIRSSFSSLETDTVDMEGKDEPIRKLSDASYSSSLFAQQHLVLVRNPYFLFKAMDDEEYKRLEAFVKDPPQDAEILFYCSGQRPNGKLKTWRMLSKHVKILRRDAPDEKLFPQEVRRALSAANIRLPWGGEEYMARSCMNDTGILAQNIAKLKLYEGEITMDVLRQLVPEVISSDNFALIDALLQKRTADVFRLIRDYRQVNESILPLLATIGTSLRYLYGVDYLRRRGWSRQQIAEEIGKPNCSVYRVQKAEETLQRTDMYRILEMLKDLSALDEAIKTDSSLSESARFDLFLLHWGKAYEAH
ncbi:MAG: DNA polymerase III subunit delta [Erysipelotrichaceae bacterium]|nr:DNA polymerase III subunit delta [Erysipelotrichaceae bacterium]